MVFMPSCSYSLFYYTPVSPSPHERAPLPLLRSALENLTYLGNNKLELRGKEFALFERSPQAWSKRALKIALYTGLYLLSPWALGAFFGLACASRCFHRIAVGTPFRSFKTPSGMGAFDLCSIRFSQTRYLYYSLRIGSEFPLDREEVQETILSEARDLLTRYSKYPLEVTITPLPAEGPNPPDLYTVLGSNLLNLSDQIYLDRRVSASLNHPRAKGFDTAMQICEQVLGRVSLTPSNFS